MLKYEVIRTRFKLSYSRHDDYHRKYSPAYIWVDTYALWYEYGQPHRKDGHAIIWRNGKKNYYIRGEHVEI